MTLLRMFHLFLEEEEKEEMEGEELPYHFRNTNGFFYFRPYFSVAFSFKGALAY